MVNKYKKKTNQGSWDAVTMAAALKECQQGNSIKSVATKYNLAFSTLYRHVKSGSTSNTLGRFRCVFNDVQEHELASYLKEVDGVFYGLTRDEFKSLAYEFAKGNKLNYPPSWDKHLKAGDDWLVGFMKRHADLALRSPEPTSVGRARGFNRPQVERFYQNLSDQIEKNNIDGCRLYNMDETGIMTTTNKPPKVISQRGKKQVGVIASAERGILTTVICCCNAAGSFIPPFMIFARKRMQDRLLDGAPPETQGTCSPSGWINGELFLTWLKFFIEKVRPTKNNKVLLLLDNHESHKYYPALEYASKNNVIFVSFAPHTTHKMQPLDRAVYGPIKRYFEQEINMYQKMHPGRIINQYDVAKLFAPAYLKGATPQNAVSGFKSPGIWPVNPNIFGDEDYAPASVTDREVRELHPNTSPQTLPDHNPDTSAVPSTSKSLSPVPSTSLDQSENKENESNRPLTINIKDIRPLPKANLPISTRKRRCQRSEILTSTPIKRAQLERIKKPQALPTKEKKKLFQNKKKKVSRGSAQKYEDCVCIVCNETYTEVGGKPIEDWIQCNMCKHWGHEKCTSYSGKGAFVCDTCL